jgi:hypothetical protein
MAILLSFPHARQCIGPDGQVLGLADLPAAGTARWVTRRKAEVCAAIRGGLMSVPEACERWGLTPQELALWQDAIDRAGVPGLRVTRIQAYRGYDRRTAAPARTASVSA